METTTKPRQKPVFNQLDDLLTTLELEINDARLEYTSYQWLINAVLDARKLLFDGMYLEDEQDALQALTALCKQVWQSRLDPIERAAVQFYFIGRLKLETFYGSLEEN